MWTPSGEQEELAMAIEKNKASGLKGLLALVEKKFGRGTIMTFDSEAERQIDVFSTGSIWRSA